jgi:hypothetical protein
MPPPPLESSMEGETDFRPPLPPRKRRGVRPKITEAQQQPCHRRRKRGQYVLNDDDYIPLDFKGIPTDEEEESQYPSNNNNNKKHPSSLPILLIQREYGCHRASMWQWQSQMLTTTNSDDSTTTRNNSSSPSRWHSFAHRQIPFTALETPTSEAVLALDATGSYALSLSFMSNDNDDDNDSTAAAAANNDDFPPGRYNHLHQEIPSIALSFYGIPSRCIPQKRAAGMARSGNHMIVSPKLLTIPLEYASSSLSSLARLHDDADGNVFGDDIIPAVVELCISSDWRIGISHVRPIVASSSGRHEHEQLQLEQMGQSSSSHAGSVVIFPLPATVSRPPPPTHVDDDDDIHSTTSTMMIRVLKARHVPLATPVPHGKRTTLRGRNLLWMLDCIPKCKTQSHSASTFTSNNHKNHNANSITQHPFIVTGIVEQPAYLYLMDDSEGLLLTWIVENGWDTTTRQQQQEPVPSALPLFRYQPRSQVLTVPNDTFWTESWSDRQTGCRYEEDDESDDDDSDDDNGRVKSSTRTNHEMTGQLGIAMEARLGIVELLTDILRRHPKWLAATKSGDSCNRTGDGGGEHDHDADVNYVYVNKDDESSSMSRFSFSDYHYELISMTHQGRVAQLLITFCAAKTAAAGTKSTQTPWLGVIVAVDVWKRGRYQVLNFIKTNVSSSSTPTTMKNLYNPAVSHRMRELGLGPYCVQTNDLRNWAQLVCRDPSQIGDDHTLAALHINDNATNPEVWKPFLQAVKREQDDADSNESGNDNGSALPRRAQHQLQPSPFVSLSTVYPDCEAVSNHTVIFGLPVMSLKASAAPMELVYG